MPTPTPEELLQKINRLEEELAQQTEKTEQTLEQSRRAAEFAMHAYRVDHYGFIWVWDIDAKDYKKTNMRVMNPVIADRALQSRHIADNAVEGRHMQDNIIEGRMIKSKTLEGRSFKDYIIDGDMILDRTIVGRSIKDRTIPGSKLQRGAVGIEHLKPGTIDPTKIILSDVSIDIDEYNDDIIVYFYNDCGVEDAYIDEDNGDIILVIDDQIV